MFLLFLPDIFGVSRPPGQKEKRPRPPLKLRRACWSEDAEALIRYEFYLKGLKKYEADGILYVLAEEVAR